MFIVTKSFKIPIGHRLSKHLGLCQNIHGHNIKIDVEVQREKLNKNDMVIDFYNLKELVNCIISIWDHALILNANDECMNEVNSNQKIFRIILGDPTSENMCFILYNMLYDHFLRYDKELKLKSITIWESDESCAKYEPEK
jgi:6-pyruvoyltetrahydropterin/6-carboxytetrahydropterin synthase